MHRITEAIAALEAAGLPARRRYEPGAFPEVAAPVAAVGLHEARPGELTLEVTLYCPPCLGGSGWETAADLAAQALTGLGAVCCLGPCGFDRDSQLLSGRLLATWEAAAAEPQPGTEAVGLSCQVAIDGAVLAHLTDFSAKQTVKLVPVEAMGAGTLFHRAEERVWTLTIQELLPPEEAPEENGIGSFTLTVERSGNVETFASCRWVSTQRTETPAGVSQVRIAKTWTERSIAHE